LEVEVAAAAAAEKVAEGRYPAGGGGMWGKGRE